MTHYPITGLFRALDGGRAYAAKNAILTGDIRLGQDVGIWFGCVIRGDDAPIEIGERTNVQDLTMIHADPGAAHHIGREVTIGHRCVLHGVTVGDRAMIGMGSVLLKGSVVGDEAIVAAGAVIRENFEVPPRTLVAGVPGRVIRELTDEEIAIFPLRAEAYVQKMRAYAGSPG